MLSELRYAARSLRQRPGFAAVAALSLAIGIGANTAIFTLVDQILLRPLPIPSPHELVQLELPGPSMGAHFSDRAFSYPMYKDLREAGETISGLVGQYLSDANFSTGERSEFAKTLLVTGNWFPVLGVPMAAGRAIGPDDDVQIDGHPVVVLSHGFWQRRFAGKADIVNKTILLNGQRLTVLGVTAKGFRGTDRVHPPDLFVPMTMQRLVMPNWYGLDNRRFFFLHLFARLKPGTPVAQAKAEFDALVAPRLVSELAEIPTPGKRLSEGFVAKRMKLHSAATGAVSDRKQIEQIFLVLSCLVFAVLLIACANVANLLLARATGRRREIAVRLALGASRWQIVRLVLAESALLAFAGGTLGLLAANWATDAVLAFGDPNGLMTASVETTPDFRILLFTLGLSVLTGLLFGLAPAYAAAHPDVAPTLKNEASSVGGSGFANWMRKSLVVLQVALSLLLLAAATLFLTTLHNLRHNNPGFVTEQLIGFAIDPSLNGYKAPAANNLLDKLTLELQLLPGVTGVSRASEPLLADSRSQRTVTVEGYQRGGQEDMNPMVTEVGAQFFQTMRIPLLLGRDFTAGDVAGAPEVAVVNEAFVKQFFKDQSPIGRKIGFGRKAPSILIVGVARNIKQLNLREEEPTRAVYLASAQSKDITRLTFYVRSITNLAQLAPGIRLALKRIDPNLPLDGLQTMQDQIEQSLAAERVITLLCSAFGVIATLLAAIGLYGVMAYHVMRRTREIGIRMALGAQRSSVLSMVVGEAGVLALMGVGLGVPAALVLGRYAKSLLYGVEATDPMAITGAAVLLTVIAIGASLAPALRATRISPTQALRYE